jgi:hypothetical protein
MAVAVGAADSRGVMESSIERVGRSEMRADCVRPGVREAVFVEVPERVGTTACARRGAASEVSASAGARAAARGPEAATVVRSTSSEI